MSDRMAASAPGGPLPLIISPRTPVEIGVRFRGVGVREGFVPDELPSAKSQSQPTVQSIQPALSLQRIRRRTGEVEESCRLQPVGYLTRIVFSSLRAIFEVAEVRLPQ